MASKTGAEAIRSVARPALVVTVQTAWPDVTPMAVANPLRRPPINVFRIVSAVSCPGVTITSKEMPTNDSR